MRGLGILYLSDSESILLSFEKQLLLRKRMTDISV